MQTDHLTDAEIELAIRETAVALKEERQHVKLLAQGRGFPPDPLARDQMIESHQKIIANLDRDMQDLLAARAKRQPACNLVAFTERAALVQRHPYNGPAGAPLLTRPRA